MKGKGILGIMMGLMAASRFSATPMTRPKRNGYKAPTGRYRAKLDKPLGNRLERLAKKHALGVRAPQGLRTLADANQPSGFRIVSFGNY